MKRLLFAVLLICGYASAQQINPNQIQPGTNGQQLCTVGGVAGWANCGGFITSLTTTGSSGAATVVGGVLNIPEYSGGSSLPTATTANQVPASSGAGTTYTAQTIPNAFFASSTTPLYTFCHMRPDSDGLWVSYSTDGTNWHDAQVAAGATSASLRDPSCMYVPAQNKFYFVATNNGNGSSPATTIAYFTSTDLQTFTSTTYPTVNGSAVNVYAPEFFLDPVSGNYYVIAAVSLSTNHFVPYIAQFTPSTGTFGTWTALTLNGTQATNSIDFFLYYANSKYYLYYADSPSSFQETLSYATSTTLTGTYTQINTGGISFITGSATPAGDLTEGPAVYPLQNGCTRFIYDFVPSNSLSAWGSQYHTYQSDNCDGTLTTWSTPVPANISSSEHGTVIELTTNPPAQLVFNLARTQPSNSSNSGFGINTSTPGYNAAVQINTKFNGTSLNANIPGSIAMDSDASDTFPYNHSGWIGGCYGTVGGSTCPTPPGVTGGMMANIFYGYEGLAGNNLAVGGSITSQAAAFFGGINYTSLDECCSTGEGRFMSTGPNTGTYGYFQFVNTSSNNSLYFPVFNTQNQELNVLAQENITGVSSGGLSITGSSQAQVDLTSSAGAHFALYSNSGSTFGIWDYATNALVGGGDSNSFTFNNLLTASTLAATTAITETAQSAATSGANVNSPYQQWIGNAWNGSASTTSTWTCLNNLTSWSGSPANVEPLLECDYTGYNSGNTPALKIPNLIVTTINTTGGESSSDWIVFNPNQATSGANFNSPNLGWHAQYWTGSASNSDEWNIADILGTGSNPTNTLTVSHASGSTGASSVSFGSLAVNMGALTATSIATSGSSPTFKTGTASNSDIAGQLTLSSGTATYSFAGTYTSAPICTASDTTATNVVKVGTSTSTLTLTGTSADVINYICVGRN